MNDPEILNSISRAEIEFKKKFPHLDIFSLEFFIGHLVISQMEAYALEQNVTPDKIDPWIKHKLLDCIRNHYGIEFTDETMSDTEEEDETLDYQPIRCDQYRTELTGLVCSSCEKCQECGSELLHGTEGRVCSSCGVEDITHFQGERQYDQPVRTSYWKKGKHGYYQQQLEKFTTAGLKKEKLKRQITEYLSGFKEQFSQNEIDELLAYAEHETKIEVLKKMIKLVIEKNIDINIDEISEQFGISKNKVKMVNKLFQFYRQFKK